MTAPVKALVRAAEKSGCKKSQRGVVIVTSYGAMTEGTNRPMIGWCDGSEACRRDCAKICIHAEQAAILDAGASARGAELYHLKVKYGLPVPSGTPSCAECSKLMVAAGVAGVWLLGELGWRRWTAEQFHAETLDELGLHRKRRGA